MNRKVKITSNSWYLSLSHIKFPTMVTAKIENGFVYVEPSEFGLDEPDPEDEYVVDKYVFNLSEVVVC